MAMQNLKTVVTLGGTVDGSFNKIGSAFNESMGKATKTVKELEREQGKLTKEIRKSKLAGADVGLLTRRYKKLGDEIDGAREKAEAFEDASGLGEKLRGIAKAGGVAVGSIWAATTATAGLMTITNQQTAEMVGMAEAYDMSIDRFKAWNGVAQQAGLNGENIGDLVEELSNKFGEFKALGEQSSVADVFGALGIDAAMMEGMNAADQFEFIMKRLESVTDKQQAASLADMLFGGEGNKVVTYIRNTGKGLNELLDEQRQFNLLTNEGADGAKKYGHSFNNLTNTITSAWQEISGIVGGTMADDIQMLGSTVSKYVRENKAEVVSTLKSLVYGAKDFAVAIWSVGSAVNSVAQAMGGWQVIGAAIGSLIAAKLVVGMASFVATGFQVAKAIGLMKTGMAGLNVVMAANPIGLVVAAVGALIFAGVQLYQNWDAVTAWFSGKLTWFKTEFPATFNFIKTLFDWSPLGMVINNWEPITGFFSDMWGGITGIFDAGLAKVSGIWDTVSGWMDSLKFWDSDTPAPEVKSYHQIQQEQRTGRAMTAINGSYPASRGTTVHQQVGEIKVVAAPGQSPQEVAQAVHSQLGGYQNSALYDLPEAG
ncbi:phage tail protein [Vibrio sp. 10N.261.51.E5]|uniref:phage tail protein n=1 Tax=Vibrio sp. 10N.261.51.E5 TaxID=3229677 RepID=UPI00354AF489